MKNPVLAYQAKSFYNAYIALSQLQSRETGLIYLVPELVNGALSVELILKAILVEQDIPYDCEHNLKVLFDKLPEDIQIMLWAYLSIKNPAYSDLTWCQNELLMISEAFVQWRYYFEKKLATAFDANFLFAFANAAIFVMFELGYNVDLESSGKPLSPDEIARAEKVYETNRSESFKLLQEKIEKKNKRRNNDG